MSITYDDLKIYVCNKLSEIYGGAIDTYTVEYDKFMDDYGMMGSSDFFTKRNLIIYLNNIVNFLNKYQKINIKTVIPNSDICPGGAGSHAAHGYIPTDRACSTTVSKVFQKNAITIQGLVRNDDDDCIVADDMNKLLYALSTCLFNKSKITLSITNIRRLSFCSCSSSSSSSSSSSCSLFVAYMDLT